MLDSCYAPDLVLAGEKNIHDGGSEAQTPANFIFFYCCEFFSLGSSKRGGYPLWDEAGLNWIFLAMMDFQGQLAISKRELEKLSVTSSNSFHKYLNDGDVTRATAGITSFSMVRLVNFPMKPKPVLECPPSCLQAVKEGTNSNFGSWPSQDT